MIPLFVSMYWKACLSTFLQYLASSMAVILIPKYVSNILASLLFFPLTMGHCKQLTLLCIIRSNVMKPTLEPSGKHDAPCISDFDRRSIMFLGVGARAMMCRYTAPISITFFKHNSTNATTLISIIKIKVVTACLNNVIVLSTFVGIVVYTNTIVDDMYMMPTLDVGLNHTSRTPVTAAYVCRVCCVHSPAPVSRVECDTTSVRLPRGV